MTAAIFTAEDKHAPIPGLEGLTAPERIVMKHWALAPRAGMPQGSHGTQTPALVRQGRWLVICPWCASAQNASTEDHRFFCIECSNGAVDGKWITVVWPDEREDIETLLGNRPLPSQRNWEPPETLDELRKENIEHGIVA